MAGPIIREAYLSAASFATVVLVVFWGACRMLLFTIHDESYVAYSPIAMFQGAPESHYRADHAASVWIAEHCSSPVGIVVAACCFLFLFLGRAHAFAGKRRPLLDALSAICLLEVSILVVTIPLAAAMAFHHVGWGMPCNYEFGMIPVAANFLALPFFFWILSRAISARIPSHNAFRAARA